MLSRGKKTARASSGSSRQGGGFSFIGEDVVINGDISTAANLQLNGRIDGDVRCTLLHQGEKGVIAGNMEAEEARLAGFVDGTVTARILVLEATARITGDVVYETLSIESGARIDGRFSCRANGIGAAQALPPPPSEIFALEPLPAQAAG